MVVGYLALALPVGANECDNLLFTSYRPIIRDQKIKNRKENSYTIVLFIQRNLSSLPSFIFQYLFTNFYITYLSWLRQIVVFSSSKLQL